MWENSVVAVNWHASSPLRQGGHRPGNQGKVRGNERGLK